MCFEDKIIYYKMNIIENNIKQVDLFLKFLHVYLENHDGSLRKYA